MPADNKRSCSRCGSQVPVSFPAGLCPKCLLLALPPSQAGSKSADIFDIETVRGIFPDLEILDMLGAGGMGAVYKVRQPRLNRLAALKIMTGAPGREADFALRFEREAQVLAKLSHPNIVVIYDFGEAGAERTGAEPLCYFLMEHVDGTDLGQLIRSKELPPRQALSIVPQICDALQYAHDLGITHRDIKPANILLDQRGRVKIADFGLAKMVEGADAVMMTGLTQTGTAMGTPHYMAPEQWEHPDQVDHRADIYALGVVFYEMLTGERPAGVFEPPSRKSSTVSKKLDRVVLRAMDKSPERRYQNAEQMKADVSRITGGQRHIDDGAVVKPRLPLKILVGLAAAAAALVTWALWPVTTPSAQEAELGGSRTAVPMSLSGYTAGEWRPPFPDLAKLPGLVESKDGWARSSYLTVIAKTASGGEVKLQNTGIRARMRFSEDAEADAVQLILRRGSQGGDHFELRYYRNLSGTRPNQFQIRHWDNQRKQSTMLASTEVAEPVHESPEGFLLEFFAIGERLHGRINGGYPISTSVPNKTYVKPGELGLACLKYGWVRDIEIINLDGIGEAEAMKLMGLDQVVSAAADRLWQTFLVGGSRYALIEECSTWPAARQRAQDLGGHLAIFETETEEKAVREHCHSLLKQGYWIGGFAEEGASEKRWLTGALVGRLSWSVGHPGWRNDTESIGARTEGLLWPAGLAISKVEEHGRWMQIQPQKKPTLGLLVEWETRDSEAQKGARVQGRLQGSGVHLDGSALDFTKAEGITDFIQVILQDQGWVALRATGEVVASDGSARGKMIARLLPAWFNSYGTIDREGRLEIVRGASPGVREIPEGVQRAKVVDARWEDGQAIALLSDGSVRVWGEQYRTGYQEQPIWPAPPVEALRDIRQIAITHWRAAALSHGGRLSIWGGHGGASGSYDLSPFEKWGELSNIESSYEPFRVLTKDGKVYNLGGSRPLSSGLAAQGIAAISEMMMMPQGADAWVWNADPRASAQAEVDALLKRVGRLQRGSFDFRIVGAPDDSKAAVVWIEPVTEPGRQVSGATPAEQ